LDARQLINKKRDGGELSRQEISGLIEAYMGHEVPDYQMSAWLMAALIRGLSFPETLALTDALVASGDRLDLSPLGRPVMDKHSTGGVGDKVTLVLAPIVAACGAIFGKMSGRALGHTGGTIDKLESIPGFRTEVGAAGFLEQLAAIGICVAGQSPKLAPADSRLYALRDVTGTVESTGLVASSVMSKKITAGSAAVVLDIKVGRGAFFRSRGQASGVAHLMQKIGEARGVRTEAVMTSMEQPLGSAVGNSLEVLEAVAALKGNGPQDLEEVVVRLAARLLPLSDLGWDQEQSANAARQAIARGAALKKFRQWIEAQGGDPGFIEDTGRLEIATFTAAASAPRGGYVSGIDTMAVGWAVQELGAGRRRQDDPVDHGVGAVLAAKTGDPVAGGQPVATVYARSQSEAEVAAGKIGAAYEYSDEKALPPPLILE
jgi:pyrimidine-nucleoside phosphorylase